MPVLPLAVRACRLAALLALLGSLSSCVVTSVVFAGYYKAAGIGDHKAHVTEAWRGPQGELAVALEDLEGAGGREDTVLVLTADELEQMFAGKHPSGTPLLPVSHVRLPRAILFRGLALPRPPPGDPAHVPAAEWDAQPVKVEGIARYALPESPAGAPMAVHWAHSYRTGDPAETGFVLLLTRSTPAGVQGALLLPEAFRQPAWTNLMVLLAIAVDVTWITLLLA